MGMTWFPRRWAVVLLSSGIVLVVVGIPTAVIPNPVFGRSVAVTWWSYPALIITAILSGLLMATYVREPGAESETPESPTVDVSSRFGVAGAAIAFFAVGCPVCNKVVLIALGASGAITWFAPFQPLLALASIGFLAYALKARIRGASRCRIPA